MTSYPPVDPMFWEEDPDLAQMRKLGPSRSPFVPRGTSPLASNVPPAPPPPRELNFQLPDDLQPPDYQPEIARPSNPLALQDGQILAEDMPDPYDRAYSDLSSRRAAHLRQRPISTDKAYNRPTWQNALMIGANSLAGLVNASGKTHVAPISNDVLAARPKYEAAMEQWGREGSGMDAEMAGLEHAHEQKLKELRDKQAKDLNAAHINYYNRPQRQPAPDRPFGVTGGYVDANGKFHPTGGQAATKETPEQADARIEAKADKLIAQGQLKRGSPEHTAMLVNHKLPAPQKLKGGGAHRDPFRAPQSTFVAIQKTKDLAEKKIEHEFNAAKADLYLNDSALKDPTLTKEVRAATERRLNDARQKLAELEAVKKSNYEEAQAAYYAQIEAAGGSISPRSSPSAGNRIRKYNPVTDRIE